MNPLRLSILSMLLCALCLGPGAFGQNATTETSRQSNGGGNPNGMTDEERQQQVIEMKRLREQRSIASQDFYEKYKLNRTIFKLKYLKAETIVKLARQELKTIALIDQRDGTFGTEVQTERTGFRLRSGGFDTQVAQIEETIVPIPENNSVMLSATEETSQKIAQLIQSVDGTQESSVSRGFRIELVLLRGSAKGTSSAQSSTSTTREVAVSAPVGGLVAANHAIAGKWVKQGDVLLELSTTNADRMLADARSNLEIDTQKLAMATQSAETAKKMFEIGKMTQEEMDPKMLAVLEGKKDIQKDQSNIQQLEEMRKSLTPAVRATVVAPVSGRITEAASVNVNAKIDSNSVIATIAEPIAGAVNGGDGFKPQDAPFDLKQIGLGPNDLSEFGSGSYRLLSRSVVSLGSTTGPEGAASVSLPDCRCFLSFISAQDPFVVIRVQLENVKDKQSLMESTLFLSPDKPGILGVTNLNDTLVLVARRKDN